MVFESYRNRLQEEEISFERLPPAFDGFRIFFISDIHRRKLHPSLIAMVQQAGGADLVLIGGDVREKGVPLERVRHNVRRLAAIAPVYMVYGNHDYDDNIKPLQKLLQQESVRTLKNESVFLSRGRERIRLAGVDDPFTERDSLKTALADRRASGVFTLLAAHDPIIADRLNGADVDLVLSGHTHGGQMVLPLYGPVIRPGSVRTYCKGWFSLENKGGTSALAETTTGPRPVRLFVSCGYGTSKAPIRLGVPPETHLFTLRRNLL
ncbi:hypothetical protein VN24_24900 [Paenibacillus beijingensis]|uniref:Calcineurin-like phosphoesterase domain-containing protein n=2 Tax=Paenibacillus beijingensis TaxID=1126833 RepID=A0A0D5NSX0_9BACL|nr:hypothetical protein VN24_24900 [Paenibacillus beijingensis]